MTIICHHVVTKAVPIVTTPNPIVMTGKNLLGPYVRTAIVAGSWKTMLANVKMNMLTQYLLPDKPRSSRIEVTLAELMIPLSRRFRDARIAAIEHSRRSTFSRTRRSSWGSMWNAFSSFSTGSVSWLRILVILVGSDLLLGSPIVMPMSHVSCERPKLRVQDRRWRARSGYYMYILFDNDRSLHPGLPS